MVGVNSFSRFLEFLKVYFFFDLYFEATNCSFWFNVVRRRFRGWILGDALAQQWDTTTLGEE